MSLPATTDTGADPDQAARQAVTTLRLAQQAARGDSAS